MSRPKSPILVALLSLGSLAIASATTAAAPMRPSPMRPSTPHVQQDRLDFSASVSPSGNAGPSRDRLDPRQAAAAQHVSRIQEPMTSVEKGETSRVVAELIKEVGGDQLIQIIPDPSRGGVWTYWTKPTREQRERVESLANEYGVSVIVEAGAHHSASEINAAITKVAQSSPWGPKLGIVMVGKDQRDGLTVSISGPAPDDTVRGELQRYAGTPISFVPYSAPVVLQ